ncbi:cyanide hydratase [Escherichia coli]|nr:cyanide hydratase [Escherichia coli]STF75632.1 cyanide hydratase [Escherichia coli]
MEKRTPHTRLSQVKKLVNTGQVRTTLDWPPESPDNQYHLFK